MLVLISCCFIQSGEVNTKPRKGTFLFHVLYLSPAGSNMHTFLMIKFVLMLVLI